MLNYTPTTEQVISQVQCQACNKSMSAKNLKYSHAAYCIKRNQELDKPKAIPVPKKIISKLKKILPVKGVIQDEESNDETDLLKEDCNNKITLSEFNNMEIKRLEALKKTIYDNRNINPMTKLKNQITKAQEDYKANNKQLEPPMYKHTTRQNPEDIIPPEYEVRMKSAREKKNKRNMIN